MFIETKGRSLTKTILWRIIATLITWVIVYLYTGEFFESGKITITAAAVSMIAYYIFERIWNRIDWGKINRS
jgi:uncharacterized membrane protein